MNEIATEFKNSIANCKEEITIDLMARILNGELSPEQSKLLEERLAATRIEEILV